MREARGEETQEAKVSAASADAVERRKRRGFFVSGKNGTSDLINMTISADTYGSDIEGLTVGADFQITARWVAGLAFDYSRQEGNFVGGGDFDNKSSGIVGFGSFLPTDKAFVQFYAGYARKDYERERLASFIENDFVITAGRVTGDYKGDGYQVGVLVGYDFPIKNITISPRAGFDRQRIEFDSYSETGQEVQGGGLPVGAPTGLELRFDKDRETSSQTRVGVQAQVAIRAGSVVVVPQASVDWMHESDNERRVTTVSFVEDLRQTRFTYEIEPPGRLDRDWRVTNIGVVAVFRNGLQAFGNYGTLRSHRFFDSRAVTLGLRAAF